MNRMFHWQNLNEKPGDRLGTGIRHGRAWLEIGVTELHWEWNLWQSRFCFFRIASSQEDGWEISFAFPPIAFWFHIKDPLLYQPEVLLDNSVGIVDEREFEISFHDWSLRLALWGRSGEWNSKDPWWIRGVRMNVLDLLLGKWEYSERDLDLQPAIIPMPEDSYECTVRLFESTWKRPRWFARRLVRATVDIPTGIPFPGKGENSWDCGEGRRFRITCPVSTIEGAIAQVVEDVLRSRRQYGGSVNWRPESVR